MPEETEEERMLAEKAKLWAKARRAKFGPPVNDPSVRKSSRSRETSTGLKKRRSKSSGAAVPAGSSFLAEVAAAMNANPNPKLRRRSRKPGEEPGSSSSKPTRRRRSTIRKSTSTSALYFSTTDGVLTVSGANEDGEEKQGVGADETTTSKRRSSARPRSGKSSSQRPPLSKRAMSVSAIVPEDSGEGEAAKPATE